MIVAILSTIINDLCRQVPRIGMHLQTGVMNEQFMFMILGLIMNVVAAVMMRRIMIMALMIILLKKRVAERLITTN